MTGHLRGTGRRRILHLFAAAAGWFAAAACGAEPQVTEGFVNAPAAEVWRLFTTSEGYLATGAAQAEVRLAIGGEIRSHYDPKGTLGDAETIVNEILAYEPERMLAIRIKQAPASFPHRDAIAGTWTVIYYRPGGREHDARADRRPRLRRLAGLAGDAEVFRRRAIAGRSTTSPSPTGRSARGARKRRNRLSPRRQARQGRSF